MAMVSSAPDEYCDQIAVILKAEISQCKFVALCGGLSYGCSSYVPIHRNRRHVRSLVGPSFSQALESAHVFTACNEDGHYSFYEHCRCLS